MPAYSAQSIEVRPIDTADSYLDTFAPLAFGQAAYWRWQLQDRAGAPLETIANATGRELRYARSTPAEASFDLLHSDDEAYELLGALEQQTPLLRCWRIEPAASGVLVATCRFAGVFSGLEEATDKGLTATFTAPPGALEHRLTGEADDHAFEDAIEVARQLVEDQNARQSTGLQMGTLEVAGTQVDVLYERAEVLATLAELAGADPGGFDYDVRFTDEGPVLAQLLLLRRQGALRAGAAFGYGEGTLQNVSGAERMWLPPRNRVVAIGDDSVSQVAEDVPAQQAFGMYEVPLSVPDTVDAGVLLARARDHVAPGWRRFVKLTPDPNATDDDGAALTPQPWVHYWLGDDVPATIRKDSWRHDGTARIDGITVGLADDGREDRHELTFEESS